MPLLTLLLLFFCCHDIDVAVVVVKGGRMRRGWNKAVVNSFNIGPNLIEAWQPRMVNGFTQVAEEIARAHQT